MTREQEIFNKAYLGLASQGFQQAVDSMGACQYLDDHGLRCAVGHCLSNPPRHSDFNVYSLIQNNPDAAKDLAGVSFDFLADLQLCHDLGKTPVDMVELLKRFVARYYLTVPEAP